MPDENFERDALDVLEAVMRFARSLEADRESAADLVQETYLRAFRAREQFDKSRGMRPWLFAICRNEFLRTRERARWTVNLDDDADAEVLANMQMHNALRREGSDDVFSMIDFAAALERAMQSLSEECRVVFALVDVGDMSYADTASELGIPIGTVRSRLFRARRELQSRLIEHARDSGIVPSGVSPESK